MDHGIFWLCPSWATPRKLKPAGISLASLNQLRDFLRLLNNSTRLALAVCNAGEHAVMKQGNRIPPYRETLSYVPKVLDYYQRYQTNFLSVTAL